MKTLIACLISIILITACRKDDPADSLPVIIFKPGSEFTSWGDYVPVGGQLRFGISVAGGGAAITNLRVVRESGGKLLTELDKGMYIGSGGLDTTLVYYKDNNDMETWRFFVMNAARDTAFVSLTVYRGEGSAYGEILFFESITLGYPENQQFHHYLDLSTGTTYDPGTVNGHEHEIDLAAFYYLTSGKSSPTLTCPAYSSAQAHYPEFSEWPVKNSTLFDYYTSDYDLVTVEQFQAATNDSLLINGYKPQNVSGLCKFCFTGKIIPFKTAMGKFGMIHVIRSDEHNGGSIEMAVKIQK